MSERDRVQAEGILRLLLADADPSDTVRRIGWPGLATLARRHNVLLRVADRLEKGGEPGAHSFREAVLQERERARAALNVVERVSRACEKLGIAFLFPKAFQHLPDIGADLDLLVLSDDPAVDLRILEAAGLRGRRRARSRLTGATSYEIDACPTLLDVQHGRLGRMGEDGLFARMMLAAAHHRTADGREARALSAEHQLVLQGMQRIFGRTDVRLSDIVYTVSSLRRDDLDWGQVLETARAFQVLDGLACYLVYVDQIHREVIAGTPLPLPMVLRARAERWGRLEFRRGSYRFPTLRVNGALYLAKLDAEVRERNWSAAGRLCLAPAIAIGSLVRRAMHAGLRQVAAPRETRPQAARHLNSLS